MGSAGNSGGARGSVEGEEEGARRECEEDQGAGERLEMEEADSTCPFEA